MSLRFKWPDNHHDECHTLCTVSDLYLIAFRLILICLDIASGIKRSIIRSSVFSLGLHRTTIYLNARDFSALEGRESSHSVGSGVRVSLRVPLIAR